MHFDGPEMTVYEIINGAMFVGKGKMSRLEGGLLAVARKSIFLSSSDPAAHHVVSRWRLGFWRVLVRRR